MRAHLRLISLALGVGLATVAPTALPALGGPMPKVRVIATGKHAETRETIPITANPDAKPRVVMTMPPERLPSLRGGDRLEASGELQVTVDCIKRSSRCAGPTYRWNPAVRMKLVLGRTADSTLGAGAQTLGRERITCLQELPSRQHHCMLVIQKAVTEIDSSAAPCELDECHLNVVASADNPRATGREKLIIGANRPDGTIHQDKGRINAIRYRPSAQPDPPVEQTSKRRDTRVPLNEDIATVVYSQRLGGLDRGEQLAVTALVRSQVRHLAYNARTALQIVVANAPRATRPSPLVGRIATHEGEITENNGINCTQKQTPCDSPKVGVVEMLRDARAPDGDRVPLFVNVVAIYAAKRKLAAPGDRVRILRGGGLRIRRFAAALNG